MPELRFLADVHISPQTVKALRGEGWDITRVTEVMDEKAPDPDILAYAREHGQVVITQDLDFTTHLAVGGHATPSLITLRLENPRPSFVTRRLLQVVADLVAELRRGAVISVDETVVRYRLLPITTDVD